MVVLVACRTANSNSRFNCGAGAFLVVVNRRTAPLSIDSDIRTVHPDRDDSLHARDESRQVNTKPLLQAKREARMGHQARNELLPHCGCAGVYPAGYIAAVFEQANGTLGDHFGR